MKTKAGGHHALFIAIAFLPLFIPRARGDETYDRLQLGTNILKDVRVIQSTPVDVLLGYEGGYKRVPLQELPEPLKSKYPYDAQKAAEHKQQQTEKARQQQAQNVAAARGALLSQEAALRAKIKPLEEQLERLNQDIKVEDRLKQGKGKKSAERKQADALRKKKLEVREQIRKLQDQLAKVEAERHKYE